MNPNEVADGGVDERLRCYACGEVHGSARIVRTVDGREMGSHRQEWFLYNEATWVLKKFRSKRTRQGYLQQVRENRGEAGMQELRAEMLLLWQWRQGQKK
jgi:hypothetical protein